MADLVYDPNYFITARPNIDDNDELREPQKIAYAKVFDHFILKGKITDAIVVLPTGVGKTGLMGLLPYGISRGRVLIITPQLVIKDGVVGSLDPDHPNNFWLSCNVFNHISNLPCLIEYEGNATSNEILEVTNVVVVNIQKMQERLTSSLIRRVPEDFFDMIIIDEAHHSTASTWVDCLQYFSKAKVVKLTGTPYRTDGQKIVGEKIYEYKLSAAMAHEYVKSLENFKYVPDEIYLTIDNDNSKKYTIDEILELNLRDEDWISRTVAYSKECSEKIVLESLNILNAKLANNNLVPHKLIAVACSIPHAEQIKEIYEEHNCKCALIHSGMSKDEKASALNDIENHRVQAVIHVAMLGEGYDHPYLSIAAIFRPFRSDLPYAQFIGRVLRAIPLAEAKRTTDNIAQIVCHRDLFLDKLWDYYKKEIKESETIKYLSQVELEEYENETNRFIDKSIGTAEEKGIGKLIVDTYLTTELIERRKKEEQEELEKLRAIQELLGVSENQARRIVEQTKISDSPLKRPDVYIKRKQKSIDSRIKDDIVPELLNSFSLDIKDNSLKDCRLFKNPNYSWIIKKGRDNGAFLAIYITTVLNNMIGAQRKDWQFSDWELAERNLDQIEEFLSKVLEDFTDNS